MTMPNDSTTLKIHPSAEWLPKLPESEYEELREDIRKRGLREPLLVKHGWIVDGRHRYRACCELGIEPQTVEYEGSDIIEEIASRNLFRRNLTPDQRAELVVKMLGEKLASEARERQRSGLKEGPKSPVALKSAQRGRTDEKIAKIAKVGRDVARKALRARKDGQQKRTPRPELPFESQVSKRFMKWMDFYAITKHREVKRIIREICAPNE